MEWLKLYSKGWLTGSIRIQLTAEERSVWADLLCLASECRRRGIIEHAPGIPYQVEELANLFHVPVEVVKSTIAKCCADVNGSDEGTRLQVLQDGTIKIGNWEKYQSITDKAQEKKERALQGRKSKKSLQQVVVDTNDSLNRLAAKTAELTQEVKKAKSVQLLKNPDTIVDTVTGEIIEETPVKAQQ